MTVHAYVLIQTEVGRSIDVARQMATIDGVIIADDVTGPYDVIGGPRPPRWTIWDTSS